MLKRIKMLLLVIMIGMFAFVTNVSAESGNKVTLNFEGGTIHDGYVEYSKIGKLQLFKGNDLVTNITNDMTVDLNEAEYKFIIEDTSASGANTPIKLNINNWYYPMTTIAGKTKSMFKLEPSKFSETLDVKLVKARKVVNTKVENVYENITSKGVIDLTNGQEYVIDFSKTDELTEGLKSFVDLDKTLYYKRDYTGLIATDNESEAVIKIVGNKSENKAILTAVNVKAKKSEDFKGLHTKYTGSELDYNSIVDGIIYETRFDYYTKCKYDFTFKYVEDEVQTKDYKVVEGANQTYTKNKSKDATFKIDADYNLFVNGGKVYVDNVLVDSKYYISKEGSTIISLKKEYVDTLSVGEHVVKFIFNDGKEAITKFEIKEEKSSNSNVENPKTGDNITTYFILSIVSFVGVITNVMINNKKKIKY